MIDAIGTMIFWIIAAGLACVVLFFALLIFIMVCSAIAALGRALTAPFPEHRKTPREKMGRDEYLLWANRKGPYA